VIRLPLLLAFALATSACGLRPLYAGGDSGPVAQLLHSVAVQPIPNQSGYLVRSALVDRLGTTDAAPRYRLQVELDDGIEGFGIRGDSAVTRERRTLRARYRLIDSTTGAVVLDATAGSDIGIDVVSSEYATLAAEQSALERLSVIIADQIVARLGLFATRSTAR